MRRRSQLKTVLLILNLILSLVACGGDSNQRCDPNDNSMFSTETYEERYRPQFHFTSMKNWLNDPNGCVFYDDEYHMFFQHNPQGINWGNMTWGHAVSRDLVQWQQLPHALYPDDNGVCYSGSAVVDWDDSAGFQIGMEKVLVAIYTSKGRRELQSLAYSNDRGRTWEKYSDNPVLLDSDRDPKVIWHRPTSQWVMCLFRDGRISFYSSPDLKGWTFMSSIKGFNECPDMFELPVDGDPANTRWVLHGASPGNYYVGWFNGREFIPEVKNLIFDYGRNFYAAQSFSDIPEEDGRRIQVAWMKGCKYPCMPFNQQMSFPCVLELRNLSDGIRLCRMPVKEIENLYEEIFTYEDKVLEEAGVNLLTGISGDLFDIEIIIEPGTTNEFGFRLYDQTIKYSAQNVFCLGKSAPLSPSGGIVKLRILVDRTSIEVFGNDGEISMTSCFLPNDSETGLELYARGPNAWIRSLTVRKLRSSWVDAENGENPVIEDQL